MSVCGVSPGARVCFFVHRHSGRPVASMSFNVHSYNLLACSAPWRVTNNWCVESITNSEKGTQIFACSCS